MEIRVAIFEDNTLVRNALEAILNGTQGFTCTGCFGNAKTWKIDLEYSRPDVILMDIEMPEIDGIKATELIKTNYPEVKILIQTVFEDNEKIFKALSAGASGYILKNDSPAKLIEALTDVFNGGAAINNVVAKRILSFFSQKNVILVPPQNTNYQLTTREQELLSLIVKGESYQIIAEKVFISYETVRTHVKHIYQKLHVSSRAEAILKATQQGITHV